MFSPQETRPKKGPKHREDYCKGGDQIPFRQQAAGQWDQNGEGEGEGEREGEKDIRGR